MRRPKSFQYFEATPVDTSLEFGVRVRGLDYRKLSNPTLRRELYDLWIEEGVIVFEDPADEEIHLELSGVFGPCILHPAKEANENVRPGLHNVDYHPDTGWLVKVDNELRGQWLPWHTDLIYADKINHGGILRPLKLPSRLGQTGFSDKISAYNRLPRALKEKVEDLSVSYHLEMDLGKQRFGRQHDVEVVRYSQLTATLHEKEHEWPVVVHPMVITQKETGRKMLNVSPWFAVGITEMPDESGDRLLHEVMGYVLHDNNAYLHHWQPNEMVLWDNWRVLHGTPGCPPDEERFFQRTTIEGDYGLGRLANAEENNPAAYILV